MSEGGPVYALAIKFLSNERPWSTVYTLDHPVPADDEAAKRWADGMATNIGREYAVVLLKDGKQMERSGG